MTGVADLLPYLGAALIVAGVAVLVSCRRELILRWCAWAVGVPVVAGAFLLGPPGIAVLAGLVVVCAAEYARLSALPRPGHLVLTVAVLATVFGAWLTPAWLPQLSRRGIQTTTTTAGGRHTPRWCWYRCSPVTAPTASAG